jgi:hypothetical protein
VTHKSSIYLPFFRATIAGGGVIPHIHKSLVRGAKDKEGEGELDEEEMEGAPEGTQETQ